MNEQTRHNAIVERDYRGPGVWLMYWRLVLTSIKSKMQYKVSFIMFTIGEMITSFSELVVIWALFDRFGRPEGWGLAEICVFYGMVNIAFAIADAITTGFDKFGTLYVRTGDLERLMLRPRSLVVQLLVHELALRRMGRLLQGVVVLIYGLYSLGIGLNMLLLLQILLTLSGTVCFFTALFVFQATLSFWTVESLEIMNTLTYGGVEASQYPLTIYEDWFRKFFTFVILLGCVSYFPVVAILGIDDPLGTSRLFQVLAPTTGMLFLSLSLLFFHFLGLRHYQSTGS
ncbi:MAG: ABC transporter permease [Gammaproteobacteria bacterium]|uniref:ABC transporter permease n=1 Tax=OM182 bacterium MED-G24 TaxID=1986255 RepID=A0A2A5WQW9_9GAMM|nr:ABC transporter permease [Gammaproteobacteria bacterium]PDH38940.1 MAG: ABC transporter permease [OM182 bacterium MED-G24]RPG24797.1 MAG: ABC transporter permease [Gammaproteobacteria bacterium TMED50]